MRDRLGKPLQIAGLLAVLAMLALSSPGVRVEPAPETPPLARSAAPR